MGQLLHLTPSHFSFNKSSQRMNFSGLFVCWVYQLKDAAKLLQIFFAAAIVQWWLN